METPSRQTIFGDESHDLNPTVDKIRHTALLVFQVRAWMMGHCWFASLTSVETVRVEQNIKGVTLEENAGGMKAGESEWKLLSLIYWWTMIMMRIIDSLVYEFIYSIKQ